MKHSSFRAFRLHAAAFLAATTLLSLPFHATAEPASPGGQVKAKSAVKKNYLQEIQKALPAGVSLENATAEQLSAAVAQALIANQSNPAAVLEIVAAAVNATRPEQAVAIAQGVAKAFAEAPTLTQEAPKIAKVLGEGLAAKQGEPKELGNIMGAATAEIVKGIDKSNTDLITNTLTAALTAAPAIDFTAAAYETVMDAVRQFDTGNVIEDKVTNDVVQSVSQEIADQIVPNVNGLDNPAKLITENLNQVPNNVDTRPERPVESATLPQ